MFREEPEESEAEKGNSVKGPSVGVSGTEPGSREARDAKEAREAQERPLRPKAASGMPGGALSTIHEPMGICRPSCYFIILGVERPEDASLHRLVDSTSGPGPGILAMLEAPAGTSLLGFAGRGSFS